MTDKTTPPAWALRRASERVNLLFTTDERMYWTYDVNPTFRALCDMIAKHEQPPVDRKLLCAREATKDWPYDDTYGEEETACVRAIELWEEGYGKENQS